MSEGKQKTAFLEYEANQWFKRNFEALKNYREKDDKIICLLKDYKIEPVRILEIGCSAGHRLNGLKKTYPLTDVYGVEPSKEAIAYGETQYPNVHFLNTTADDMNKFEDESFDVVIVGFVFYVIDRRLLLKSISEIDRLLKDKGYLIIMDFFTETTVKKNYAHINEFSAYSFKENYDEVFTATHLYHLMDKSCYNHETLQKDGQEDFQNLYSISLLKKDLNASYK